MVRGGVVLLDVARVEVVEHVIHRQPRTELNSVATKREVNGVLDLRVQSQQCRQTSCVILCANKIPVLIEPRERKTRVHVQYWNKIKLVRQPDHGPEKPTVRRIRRKRAILIRPDERIRKVAEELGGGVPKRFVSSWAQWMGRLEWMPAPWGVLSRLQPRGDYCPHISCPCCRGFCDAPAKPPRTS